MSERREGNREEAAKDARPAARDAESGATPLNEVDEASKESFPASDAPAWEPLHTGAPGDHPHDRKGG